MLSFVLLTVCAKFYHVLGYLIDLKKMKNDNDGLFNSRSTRRTDSLEYCEESLSQ